MNLEQTLARLERADKLLDAERNAAWVIRVPRVTRQRSKNEREPRHRGDNMTCFHGNSYTIPCKNCRRSVEDANREWNRIKALLSIT